MPQHTLAGRVGDDIRIANFIVVDGHLAGPRIRRGCGSAMVTNGPLPNKEGFVCAWSTYMPRLACQSAYGFLELPPRDESDRRGPTDKRLIGLRALHKQKLPLFG